MLPTTYRMFAFRWWWWTGSSSPGAPSSPTSPSSCSVSVILQILFNVVLILETLWSLSLPPSLILPCRSFSNFVQCRFAFSVSMSPPSATEANLPEFCDVYYGGLADRCSKMGLELPWTRER